MDTQHRELRSSNETSNPTDNDVLPNSNFNYQIFPRTQPYGNLKLVKKIKQYPVRSAVVAVIIVIVLSVSITSIFVFNKNRHSIETTTTTTSISTITTTPCNRFLPQVTYSTGIGSHPFSVTTANVDEDSSIDIIVANQRTNNVGVLLNRGNGTFATRVTYAAGRGPYSVAANDIDGDGKIDIIVANSESNNVGIFFNTGNGTFAAQLTFPSGTNPRSLVAADVNDDTKLDIIVGNSGSDSVGVFLADCI